MTPRDNGYDADVYPRIVQESDRHWGATEEHGTMTGNAAGPGVLAPLVALQKALADLQTHHLSLLQRVLVLETQTQDHEQRIQVLEAQVERTRADASNKRRDWQQQLTADQRRILSDAREDMKTYGPAWVLLDRQLLVRLAEMLDALTATGT